MKVADPNKVRRAMWHGNEEWSGLRRVSILGDMGGGRRLVGFPHPEDKEQVVFAMAQSADLTFLEGTSNLAVELGL